MTPTLISIVDRPELKSRSEDIVRKLDSLLKEIGPKIQEIGQLREELETIQRELIRRGPDGE